MRGVDLTSLVRPELVRFKAHDGLELTAWLYRPAGVSNRAPSERVSTGGRKVRERPGFLSDYQALLAQNFRLRPQYPRLGGVRKAVCEFYNGPLRVDAVRDITACVNYVIQAKAADPSRIGIMGGSYGGYMVMAGLTEYPDLFAAGANSDRCRQLRDLLLPHGTLDGCNFHRRVRRPEDAIAVAA